MRRPLHMYPLRYVFCDFQQFLNMSRMDFEEKFPKLFSDYSIIYSIWTDKLKVLVKHKYN